MQKWEYKIVSWMEWSGRSLPMGDHLKIWEDDKELELHAPQGGNLMTEWLAYLNRLGGDGWQPAWREESRYYFKRPKD